MRRSIVLGALLLGSCAIPDAVNALGASSPPPELGRPAWVRFFAGTGAWVGGIVGGVASLAVLPVTWPISLLAEDELGPDGTVEFLFFPAVGGAAVGHALLGGAADIVDFGARRAWVDDEADPVTSYEFVPQEAPDSDPGSAPRR